MSIESSTSNECSSSSLSNYDFEIVKVRDHVGLYVFGKDGTRTWYPDILAHGEKPIQGTQSISIDQAYSFYVAYGKKAGFDVRRGGKYKAVGFGDATTKYFHCTSEGFLLNLKEKFGVKSLDVDISKNNEVSDGFERFRDPKKKQTRRKPTFRCVCLASLTIKRIGNVFEVTSLIEGHKHPLIAEKHMIFMKNSRNIGYTKQHFLYQVSNANFGPAIGFRLMKQIHGCFDRVGVTVNDCKNQKKNISVFIRERDAQIAVEKLLSQKLHSLGLYANYYKGDDERLVGLFWADEEAIRNYATFGDITTGGYIWLLKQFKEAFGKDLKVVVTDQDPLMKITIVECFPDTRHRLYMCHIMMKLGTKVGPALYEMFALYKYCIALSVVQTENTKTYSVRDTQYHIFKGSDQFPVYPVEFCKSEVKLHCSYNRYEAYGLLCRHVFYVLRMNNVKEFPENYLHKRWLKNVKPSSFGRRRITGASDVVQSEMKELLNQVEIDVPTIPKVSSKAVMSAMLGVDEPENVLIGNPNLSKVKGTCCFSRMKPVAEVTAEKLAKRRTCSVCGGKEGHNKRTCTNEPASTKPKVQAAPKEKAAPKQQASQPKRSGLRSMHYSNNPINIRYWLMLNTQLTCLRSKGDRWEIGGGDQWETGGGDRWEIGGGDRWEIVNRTMTTVNQGMSFEEIEQIVAHQVANAIETIAIYENKTCMACESICQTKRLGSKA
ncbi:FAR1 DNA binding domain, zinc finger, SWIM-type, MULE transposase domain containing protein [Tanacetum coccineum]